MNDQHTNKFSSAVINAHPRRTFSDGDDWQSEFELLPFQEYCETVYVAMKRIQRRHAAVHWRDVDNGLMPKDARITIGMIRQELNGGHRDRWDLEALNSLVSDGLIERYSEIPPSKWVLADPPRILQTPPKDARGFNNSRLVMDEDDDMSIQMEAD